MDKTPGFLILAAGQGRRFGGNKLTAILDNKPLIHHCLDKLTQLNYPISIIYDPNNKDLQHSILSYDIHKIAYPSADLGMGNTLAHGVRETPDWNGWIVCLGDMPWVSIDTYRQIAKQLSHHKIVRPTLTARLNHNQEQQGHPVGFQQHFKQELLALTGDVGAKPVISRHKSALYCFETSDCGILLDIDHPSDLNRPPYTV